MYNTHFKNNFNVLFDQWKLDELQKKQENLQETKREINEKLRSFGNNSRFSKRAATLRSDGKIIAGDYAFEMVNNSLNVSRNFTQGNGIIK